MYLKMIKRLGAYVVIGVLWLTLPGMFMSVIEWSEKTIEAYPELSASVDDINTRMTVDTESLMLGKNIK